MSQSQNCAIFVVFFCPSLICSPFGKFDALSKEKGDIKFAERKETRNPRARVLDSTGKRFTPLNSARDSPKRNLR